MAQLRAASPDQARFLEELLQAGLLLASGVPGVYGRGEGFETIRRAVDGLIDAASALVAGSDDGGNAHV